MQPLVELLHIQALHYLRYILMSANFYDMVLWGTWVVACFAQVII